MPKRDIVVIGASAGGVQALIDLVGKLPANLPAAIFIVVHIPADAQSMLPNILSRAGQLPAVHATEGQPVQTGHIYIAPPDRHLVFMDSSLHLSRGPRENGLRPAIDPLFRSAARVYGPRVIGVVLTGTRTDGTFGMVMIGSAGGVTIAQDPEEAMFPGMPLSAISKDDIEYVLPVAEIAAEIIKLAGQEVEDQAQTPELSGEQNTSNGQNQKESKQMDEPESKQDPQPTEVVDDIEASMEPPINEAVRAAMHDFEQGKIVPLISTLTCPECGGVLVRLPGEKQVRYQCHVGHLYTAEALVSLQGKTLEAALWMAVRTLEERAALAKRMADRSHPSQQVRIHQMFEERAAEAERSAELIRALLLNGALFDSPLDQASQESEQPESG